MNPTGALLHAFFEMLAISFGFRWFLRLRRLGHPTAAHPGGLWVLVGGILGAAVGAWGLDALQYWTWHRAHGPMSWFVGGRTIVGGLLGGWVGVEIAKARTDVRGSTGDLLVRPLLLGMAIGRLACLFAGPTDLTWGGPTTLPWGIDLGDNIPRHPTPIYDMLFLGAVGLLFEPLARRLGAREGERFLAFVMVYLGWRFASDFWKAPHLGASGGPTPDRWLLGWTAIQWVAVLGMAAALASAARRRAAG